MTTENNFVKHYMAGQPTKYDKEKHIRLLFSVFNKGEGVMAFCAETLISKKAFYDWLKVHEEFKEAYEGALCIAGRWWEAYPLTDPDFNFGYWSAIMRNRFGYGKAKISSTEDITPIGRINAIWKGLEEGELTSQEATQMTSIAIAQANIQNNQLPGDTNGFKRATREELIEAAQAIQTIIDYKEGK